MRLTKTDYRHDAQLLRRIADEIEEMKIGGSSPFWRYVARKRLETNLRLADNPTLRRLRKLDDRETAAETLVASLREMAAERAVKCAG